MDNLKVVKKYPEFTLYELPENTDRKCEHLACDGYANRRASYLVDDDVTCHTMCTKCYMELKPVWDKQ